MAGSHTDMRQASGNVRRPDCQAPHGTTHRVLIIQRILIGEACVSLALIPDRPGEIVPAEVLNSGQETSVRGGSSHAADTNHLATAKHKASFTTRPS